MSLPDKNVTMTRCVAPEALALCAAPKVLTRCVAPEALVAPEAPDQRIRKPRGRPRASARWDGKQWVLDPDAAEQAAKTMVAHRKTCRDRKRATRALLKQMKPVLFGKAQTTLTACVNTAEDRMYGSIKDSKRIYQPSYQPISQPDTQRQRHHLQCSAKRYEIRAEQSVAAA